MALKEGGRGFGVVTIAVGRLLHRVVLYVRALEEFCKRGGSKINGHHKREERSQKTGLKSYFSSGCQPRELRPLLRGLVDGRNSIVSVVGRVKTLARQMHLEKLTWQDMFGSSTWKQRPLALLL